MGYSKPTITVGVRFSLDDWQDLAAESDRDGIPIADVVRRRFGLPALPSRRKHRRRELVAAGVGADDR